MGRNNTYQIQEILNDVYNPSTNALNTQAGFSGDIEIGAVEIKNASTDDRLSVLAASTSALATHNPAVVALHPSSPLPTGTNVIGSVTVGSFPSANTATFSAITSSATSTLLQASNTNRKGLVVLNNSTATLYIQYSAVAATATATYKVASQGIFEMTNSVYTGNVAGIWDAANGIAQVTEF